MQDTNVAKDDRGRTGRVQNKSRSLGEIVLPGYPVGQVSKLNVAKPKEKEGLKRTSVAVLKYNPGLSKSRQLDKRKRPLKKGVGKEQDEAQLWSNVSGGTEIHFSGHAIRHLKPRSESKKYPETQSPETKYPVTNPREVPSTKQPHSTVTPQSWTPIRKIEPIQEDIKVYRGPWSCFHYLCDQLCCRTRTKTTILYQ
uniref:uncharacterized protein isoform X2 n=1 Tax=Pristiophorus japonicus TaxID=55135 RepID=UPI00398E99AB